MPSRSQRTVIALVPDLMDQVSHYYFYHLGMAEAARRVSLQYRVMAPAECTISSLPDGWEKCLVQSAALGDNSSWFTSLLHKRACRVALTRCLKTNLRASPDLCLFLEVSSDRVLRQLVRIVLIPGARPKSILLMVREAPDTSYSRGRRIQWWLRLLGILYGAGGLRICVDTELLADAWKPIVGYRPVVLPVLPLIVEAEPPSVQGQKLRCWWPGHPSKRKGLSWIQRLVANQTPEAAALQVLCSEYAALSSVDGLVEVVRLPAELSQEAYRGQLHASDVILIPYTRDRYQMSSSGIFVEAIHAGKLVLTCDQTWMASELRNYGLDALIVDWSRDDLPKIICELAQDEEVQKKLAVMQASYRQFHSIDNLAARLEACIA